MKYGHKRKLLDFEIEFRKWNKGRADITGNLLSEASQLAITCQKVMGGIYFGHVIQDRKMTDAIEEVEDVARHSKQPGLDTRSYQICKKSDLDSDKDIQNQAAEERKELGLG